MSSPDVELSSMAGGIEGPSAFRRTDSHASQKSPMVPETSTHGPVKIHEKSIEEVLEQFNTSTKGIDPAEAKRRFEMDGPNELEKPPVPSLLVLFLIQLNSVIMYLLMAAVIASAAIKATQDDKDKFISYVDSIAILIIVLINATIAAVTEKGANDALEALSSLQAPMATVIRGGNEVQIESREIVRGDIVKLGMGDVVPADIRCMEANDFRVNEMLLTGEPEDVAKNNKVKPRVPGQPEKLTADNMAFSSCNVKGGSCIGVVVATGMTTRVGSIAALLNESGADKGDEEEGGCTKYLPQLPESMRLPDTKKGQSPLQENLEKLAVKLGYMAIAICLVVFAVGAGMGTSDPENPDTPSWLFMILVAVTLTVAAIPEGLPLCVTIALSSGCSSMVKENVLMRKIAAVETLGSASIICTDKTGTLTEGKMTLVAMYAGLAEFSVTGKGFDPTGGEVLTMSKQNANKDSTVRATLASAVLCSNTTLKLETDPETNQKKWTPHGNSSEAPLVVAGHKIGILLEKLEKSLKRVFEIPFSSSRKMMVTITKVLSGEVELTHVGEVGDHCAHVKGAPNYIMEKCTSYMASDGTIKPLDEATKKVYMDKVDELSSKALRVLAIASVVLGKDLPFGDEEEPDTKFAKIARDMTLCGLCASIDPERNGVKEAVLQSRTAGVRVVMITGDYLKTAIAIAKNINILNASTFTEGNGEASDCGDLRPGKDGEYISPQEIDAMTRTTSVFARAKPEDKLEIVKSLQRQGWVCAMTGDGVNDAPALQRADIGVAMGLEGTEVAKGASDMILTDDNFCSIVKAIEKGRVIYAGIQKFVSFIMSVHFAEVLQIFLCIVCSIPVMRQPLQILFLILVTDLPPSIALGFEPGEALTMKRQPRPKTQPVVMMWMWRGIVANGCILTVCIFCTYMLALWAYAGAFTSDAITDPARERCTIWKYQDWTPKLEFECVPKDANKGWVACSSKANSGLYTGEAKRLYKEEEFMSRCKNWQSERPYVKDDGAWQSKANEVFNAAKAEDATGALYFKNPKCEKCIDTSIRKARTCAFISLVWAEGFRAYCSRSFENPVWVGAFNNKYMNYAVLMAQVTLILALFIPGLNQDVLGLYVLEIKGFGWFLAFVGAFSCLVFCEVYKYFSKFYIEEAALAGYEENEDGTTKGSV